MGQHHGHQFSKEDLETEQLKYRTTPDSVDVWFESIKSNPSLFTEIEAFAGNVYSHHENGISGVATAPKSLLLRQQMYA
jgi:hypothetical protein